MNDTTDQADRTDRAWEQRLARAVAAHLEAHGTASAGELDRMLAHHLAGYRPEPGSPALRRQLARLADGGHVHAVTVGGRRRWRCGPGPVAERMASARRVTRLDTSVYMPMHSPVVRPGALDFTRVPSLLLGTRFGYWGSAQ
ncbi:hypothetical protein D3C71_692480 [compost metagenome]